MVGVGQQKQKYNVEEWAGKTLAYQMRTRAGICDGLCLHTLANLDGTRGGKSPLVTKGPYAGEIAEVDHILPVAKFPEFEREFWNLEMMPCMLNRRKGDTVGQRQIERLRWARSRK